jgi:hypothetical protein
MEVIFWKLLELAARIGGYTSRPLGAVLIWAATIALGYWLGGTRGVILTWGAIIAGGFSLGLYIFSKRETRMLEAAFYISTGLLALCASSWLGYGLYHAYYTITLEIPEKWLRGSEAVKIFVPPDLVEEWQIQSKLEHDLPIEIDQLHNEIEHKSHRPPAILPDEWKEPIDLPSLREKETALRSKLQGSTGSRLHAEQRISDSLRTLLLNGELSAQGIPDRAGADQSAPVKIARAQWEYLFIEQGTSFSRAVVNARLQATMTGYNALEFQKSMLPPSKP